MQNLMGVYFLLLSSAYNIIFHNFSIYNKNLINLLKLFIIKLSICLYKS